MNMYFSSVKNPAWINEEKTLINCEVIFSHLSQSTYYPFTADPLDSAPYSRMIFDECAAGKYGEVAAFVPPPPMTERELARAALSRETLGTIPVAII